jgi:endonuclease I
LNYGHTDEALQVSDANPEDSTAVILIYSRRSEPGENFGETTGWNREHLWPNSYGIDDRLPAHSDLHNLRPADWNVNSARGNKVYDDSDLEDRNYGSPAHTEAPLTSKDTDSWEQPDEVKGDIARAMFYMDVRFEGGDSGEPDLILTDDLASIESTASFMGKVSTLLAWHFADPVNDGERERNDRVESIQGNRNPFVDVPEFVQLIYLDVEESPELTITMENGSVVVSSWSSLFTGFQLQESSGMDIEWSETTLRPSLIQSRWRVNILPTGSRGLFRLSAISP